MAKKAPKKKEALVQPVYSIAMKVNGQTLVATGETIPEALLKFPPINPKTTASFVVTHNDTQGKAMVLNINALKRIFYPGMTGQINRLAFERRARFF